jgi:hypothetical protein
MGGARVSHHCRWWWEKIIIAGAAKNMFPPRDKALDYEQVCLFMYTLQIFPLVIVQYV